MRMFMVKHPMLTDQGRWYHVTCERYIVGELPECKVEQIAHPASGYPSEYAFTPSGTWSSEPTEWDILCVPGPLTVSLLPGPCLRRLTLGSHYAVDFWSHIVTDAIRKVLDDEEYKMAAACQVKINGELTDFAR